MRLFSRIFFVSNFYRSGDRPAMFTVSRIGITKSCRNSVKFASSQAPETVKLLSKSGWKGYLPQRTRRTRRK